MSLPVLLPVAAYFTPWFIQEINAQTAPTVGNAQAAEIDDSLPFFYQLDDYFIFKYRKVKNIENTMV